ncbi:MAG: TfoX/Sxy family protein [Candidatus Coproplasma sp.]
MATDLSYVQFVCDCLKGESPTYKKMFGEYMIYIDGKPVLLVCDNTVFVKKYAELADLLHDADCGYPYDGAKEHYILDVEDEELTQEVLAILKRVAQLPKQRKRK